MAARWLPVLALVGLFWHASLAPAQAPERPRRPYLGVLAEAVPGGTERAGVRVRDVAPGSPAAEAGLKRGDEIVKVGNKKVENFEGLANALTQHKPGDKVPLEVVRDGKEQTLTVTLGERPRAAQPAQPPRRRATAFLGVETRPLTPEEKTRLGVSVDSGAEVMEVAPGTPAAAAGLQRGDVITSLDGKAVSNPEALREAVRQAGAGKEVTVQAARGKETKEFKAKLEESPADFFTPLPFPEGRGSLERRLERLERRVQELETKLGQQPPK